MKDDPTEWLGKKNLELRDQYEISQKKCEELQEKLNQKEFDEYGLERTIKEMRTELDTLSHTKEKLNLANRNARILEEENNSLMSKLKAIEQNTPGHRHVTPGPEAKKMLDENLELWKENNALKEQFNAKNEEHTLAESTYTQKNAALLQEREQLAKELEVLKRQCAEYSSQLQSQDEELLLAKEKLVQEKQHHAKTSGDLLLSLQKAEQQNQIKEGRNGKKDRDGDVSLEKMLFLEDVNRLEEKLKNAENRLWESEKRSREREAALTNELATLKQNDAKRVDYDLYLALQEQLNTLRLQLNKVQQQRKSARNMSREPAFGSKLDISEDLVDDDFGNVLVKDLQNRCDAILQENEQLHDEIENLTEQNTFLSEQLREHLTGDTLGVGREYIYSTEAGLPPNDHGRLSRGNTHVGETGEDDISKIVDEYRLRCEDLLSAQEHQQAVFSAREQECENQLALAEEENQALRNRVDQLSQELAGGHYGRGGSLDTNDQAKLIKDKCDCIDDLMHNLEASWFNEDEKKRQLKQASDELAKNGSSAGHRNRDNVDRTYYRDPKHDDRVADTLRAQEDEISRQSGRISQLEKQNDALRQRARRAEREAPTPTRASEALQSHRARHRSGPNDRQRALSATERTPYDVDDRRESGYYTNNRSLNTSNQPSPTRQSYDRRKAQSSNLRRKSLRPRSVSERSRDRLGNSSVGSFGLNGSQESIDVAEEKRNVVDEGAHLSVTLVELSNICRNGRPISDPGYIIVKLKSIKEKQKTTTKELAPVVRFNEVFQFYLAEPDKDIITLHVYYRQKGTSREHHVGDVAFSMSTLHRGVPRRRIAPVAQNPCTKNAMRAAQVEIIMQSSDFGISTVPTDGEIARENIRFNELAKHFEVNEPQKLHATDVYMNEGPL